MHRLLTILLCLSFLSTNLRAEEKQDFVGQFVAQLQETGTDEQEKDYHCITVSPEMIQKMLQMAEQAEEGNPRNEQIQKILPNIRSLRIFIAMRNAEDYKKQIEQLLNKKKSLYLPYQSETKEKKEPCIWLRRDKEKVIEIIALQQQEYEEDSRFKVVDLTGNLNGDFVKELLKM